MDISPLPVASFANIFSHSEGCLFILFMFSFAVQKLLSFIRCHLFIFVFIFITLGGGSKKILLQFMSKSVLPMFSFKSFIVSRFTFRSLIHFEFIFVYGVRECSNFILLHVAIQFSQHHLLKRLSFLHCIIFASFFIDKVTVGVFTLCLLIGAFHTSTFKIIVDRYVFIAFLFLVSSRFCSCSLFIPCFCFYRYGLMIFFTSVFGFLSCQFLCIYCRLLIYGYQGVHICWPIIVSTCFKLIVI